MDETSSLYDRARLEEESGDLPGARAHYREFLDRWGNADPPISQAGEASSRLELLPVRPE